MTDEDRRKVAQRLRECRGGWSSGECYYTIIHALGLPDTSREDGGHALYAALASMIDPEPERTCHMDKIGGDRVLAGWWECSECGPVYPPCNDKIAKWALQRCPRCGAKVVDE